MDRILDEIIDAIKIKYGHRADVEKLIGLSKDIYGCFCNKKNRLGKAGKNLEKERKELGFEGSALKVLIVERFIAGAIYRLESVDMTTHDVSSDWKKIKPELRAIKGSKEKLDKSIDSIQRASEYASLVAESPNYRYSWEGSEEFSVQELNRQLEHLKHMIFIISRFDFSKDAADPLGDSRAVVYAESVCKFYTNEAIRLTIPKEIIVDAFQYVEVHFNVPNLAGIAEKTVEKLNRRMSRDKKKSVKKFTESLLKS